MVTPRSHCPHCDRPIAWYDNIPLWSWLALRARCRACGGRISPRYVLVELLTAVLFLLVGWIYGVDARTPVYWLIVAGLILGTFVDLEHLIIPDRVSLGGWVAGLALSPLLPSLHGADGWRDGLVAAAIGLAAGAGTLWVVGVLGKAVFRKDAMGLGDVKLLGGLGALLGWRAVVFIIMGSSLAGSAVGLGLIAAGKQEWQSRLPYGPYLALAAVVWILRGQVWWNAYFNWLMPAG